MVINIANILAEFLLSYITYSLINYVQNYKKLIYIILIIFISYFLNLYYYSIFSVIILFIIIINYKNISEIINNEKSLLILNKSDYKLLDLIKLANKKIKLENNSNNIYDLYLIMLKNNIILKDTYGSRIRFLLSKLSNIENYYVNNSTLLQLELNNVNSIILELNVITNKISKKIEISEFNELNDKLNILNFKIISLEFNNIDKLILDINNLTTKFEIEYDN